jgi:hypothetical protein
MKRKVNLNKFKDERACLAKFFLKEMTSQF